MKHLVQFQTLLRQLVFVVFSSIAFVSYGQQGGG